LYLVMNLMSELESNPASFVKKLAAGWWNKTIQRSFEHLPLSDIDQFLMGKQKDFFQEGIRSQEPGSTYWDSRDELFDFENCDMPPCSLLIGWYDIFLEGGLRDYQRAREKHQDVRMTVGNFHHWGLLAKQPLYSNILVDFFATNLRDARGDDSQPSAIGPLTSSPVNLQIIGAPRASSWRGFEEFPPPATSKEFWLAPGQQLLDAASTSRDMQLDEYAYDPLRPTLALGGPSFNPMNAGERDQARIEQRSDIIVYTSEPLEEDLEIIGPVVLRLRCSHTAESTDFLGRLCDVGPEKSGKSGRSFNRCEGLLRLTGSKTEVRDVEINMGHVAALFKQGHRIRLQICSGAHPRWMRNLGYGDPVATATRTTTSHNRVFEGSHLVLPVVAPGVASLRPVSQL